MRRHALLPLLLLIVATVFAPTPAAAETGMLQGTFAITSSTFEAAGTYLSSSGGGTYSLSGTGNPCAATTGTGSGTIGQTAVNFTYVSVPGSWTLTGSGGSGFAATLATQCGSESGQMNGPFTT